MNPQHFWSGLSKSTKGWYASQFFLAFTLLGGAINRTVEGTWDALPVYAKVVYSLGSAMVACSTFIGFGMWREDSVVHGRLQNHLDAETPRDKYGFLSMLDLAELADLEHALGFVHVSESKPFCGRTTCWKEDQNPEYVMENGFLAIAAFPELPKEASQVDKFGRKLKRTFDPSLRELADATPWGITPNEAREMGYAAPTMALESLQELDKSQTEYYAHRVQQSKHQHELRKLQNMVEASLTKGQAMVFPDGYRVQYRRGEELVHIQSPTGLEVYVDISSYRNRPAVAASDRRRDDGPEEHFQKALDSFKERPSDEIRFEQSNHH